MVPSYVTKQANEYTDKLIKVNQIIMIRFLNTSKIYLLSWLIPYDDRLSKYFNVSGFSCSLGATNIDIFVLK